MRLTFILFCFVLLASCGNTIKLAVPAVFQEQATMMHVNGSRTRKMSFGNFTSSKIKRGMHVRYPGWNRGFMLENILLNQIGLKKEELVQKEKANFRFFLSDGNRTVQIFAKERELTRSLKYSILEGKGIFSSYERLQEYRYIFSAIIAADTQQSGKSWELMMSNIYDRKKDTVNNLFTLIRPDDNGLATNGQDTIYIKPISLKKTESANGKVGKFPISMLSGYELSTPDGVVAIIDAIDSNIWFYNELDAADKLTIAAITTAILARKVNDVKW